MRPLPTHRKQRLASWGVCGSCAVGIHLLDLWSPWDPRGASQLAKVFRLEHVCASCPAKPVKSIWVSVVLFSVSVFVDFLILKIDLPKTMHGFMFPLTFFI